jgi:hypothetical protein
VAVHGETERRAAMPEHRLQRLVRATDRDDPGSSRVPQDVHADDRQPELGRSVGEQLDKEVLNGSGAAGHLKGLLATTGVVLRTYTDAAPTRDKVFSQIMGLYNDQAVALGDTPDNVLFAPRRAAWLESQYSASNMEALERLGVNVLVLPSMPLTLGAGTNEDRIIMIDSDEIMLFLEQPKISVYPDVLSTNMQVRFQVTCYAALLANRQPTATAVLAGTASRNGDRVLEGWVSAPDLLAPLGRCADSQLWCSDRHWSMHLEVPGSCIYREDPAFINQQLGQAAERCGVSLVTAGVRSTICRVRISS